MARSVVAQPAGSRNDCPRPSRSGAPVLLSSSRFAVQYQCDADAGRAAAIAAPPPAVTALPTRTPSPARDNARRAPVHRSAARSSRLARQSKRTTRSSSSTSTCFGVSASAQHIVGIGHQLQAGALQITVQFAGGQKDALTWAQVHQVRAAASRTVRGRGGRVPRTGGRRAVARSVGRPVRTRSRGARRRVAATTGFEQGVDGLLRRRIRRRYRSPSPRSLSSSASLRRCAVPASRPAARQLRTAGESHVGHISRPAPPAVLACGCGRGSCAWHGRWGRRPRSSRSKPARACSRFGCTWIDNGWRAASTLSRNGSLPSKRAATSWPSERLGGGLDQPVQGDGCRRRSKRPRAGPDGRRSIAPRRAAGSGSSWPISVGIKVESPQL